MGGFMRAHGPRLQHAHARAQMRDGAGCVSRRKAVASNFVPPLQELYVGALLPSLRAANPGRCEVCGLHAVRHAPRRLRPSACACTAADRHACGPRHRGRAALRGCYCTRISCKHPCGCNEHMHTGAIGATLPVNTFNRPTVGLVMRRVLCGQTHPITGGAGGAGGEHVGSCRRGGALRVQHYC